MKDKTPSRLLTFVSTYNEIFYTPGSFRFLLPAYAAIELSEHFIIEIAIILS